ncbi:uncharacterized protein N7515_003420 [Penicillium bovifimosum]|uniref:Uncharacterized protein n=1 Tax=Penicillium bovifimosum TaxID=126998 RepID=A0A9W9H4L8_9EURO|nr:uncharacterized protein N7515_003420 [Penicillium bovifimosum]KAJ5138572.1 hypothetical protein N7515_003420 [Penicillium bovifimosum]
MGEIYLPCSPAASRRALTLIFLDGHEFRFVRSNWLKAAQKLMAAREPLRMLTSQSWDTPGGCDLMARAFHVPQQA